MQVCSHMHMCVVAHKHKRHSSTHCATDTKHSNNVHDVHQAIQ